MGLTLQQLDHGSRVLFEHPGEKVRGDAQGGSRGLSITWSWKGTTHHFCCWNSGLCGARVLIPKVGTRPPRGTKESNGMVSHSCFPGTLGFLCAGTTRQGEESHFNGEIDPDAKRRQVSCCKKQRCREMLEAGQSCRFAGPSGHLIPRPKYARFKNRMWEQKVKEGCSPALQGK